MSHYDNAACAAVAIKSVAFLNPAAGLLGLLAGVCFVAYPAFTDSNEPCPDGGTLTQVEVSYDGGLTSHMEDKCVIKEPSRQKIYELEQKYPDYKINVPGW